MKKSETVSCIQYLDAAYPNAYKRFDMEKFENLIAVWYNTFSEYPVQMVMVGIQGYISTDTSGFPPSPGQVIKIIQDLTAEKETNSMEAWAIVKKAVNSPRDRAKEVFDSLPPLIQKVIGGHQQLLAWGNVGEDEFETVIQSNFMRTYETEKKRQKQLQMIPERIRRMIPKGGNNERIDDHRGGDALPEHQVEQGGTESADIRVP